MKKRFLLLPLLVLVLTSCDYLDFGNLLSQTQSGDGETPITEDSSPAPSEDDGRSNGEDSSLIQSENDDTTTTDVEDPSVSEPDDPINGDRPFYGSDMPIIAPYESWGLLQEFELIHTSFYHENESDFFESQNIKRYVDGTKLTMTSFEDGYEAANYGYFYHEAPNTGYQLIGDESSFTAWAEDADRELFTYMNTQTGYLAENYIGNALHFYEELFALDSEAAINDLLADGEIDSLEITKDDNVFTFIFIAYEDDNYIVREVKFGFSNETITMFVFNESFYEPDKLFYKNNITVNIAFARFLPLYDGPRFVFEGEQTLRDLVFGSNDPSSDLVGTDLPEIKPYQEWEGISKVEYFHTIRNAADPLNDIVMTVAFNFYEESAIATFSGYSGDDSTHSLYLEGLFLDGSSVIYSEEDGVETENSTTLGSGKYEEFIASLNSMIRDLIYEALGTYRPITELSSRAEMEQYATSNNMEEIYIDYYYDDDTYYIMMDRYGPGTSQTSGEVVYIEASIAMQITVEDGMFSHFSYRSNWYEDGDEINAIYFYIEVTFDE